MANELEALLKKNSKTKAEETKVDAAQDMEESGKEREASLVAPELGDALEVVNVSCEAVVGGALMKIDFGPGSNPAAVKAFLLALDPNAEVRSEFPKRGNFGPRETKQARAIAMNLRITDNGKFIDLICQNGDDLTVNVSKKASETFEQDLKALGKLKEKSLQKVGKAFKEKGTATLILDEGEQFGVHFWSTEDGKHFLDHLSAEAPAVEADDDNENENDKGKD